MPEQQPIQAKSVAVMSDIQRALAERHLTFDNIDGHSDLMVGIANSNPASSARVTVIVIQLP